MTSTDRPERLLVSDPPGEAAQALRSPADRTTSVPARHRPSGERVVADGSDRVAPGERLRRLRRRKRLLREELASLGLLLLALALTVAVLAGQWLGTGKSSNPGLPRPSVTLVLPGGS